MIHTGFLFSDEAGFMTGRNREYSTDLSVYRGLKMPSA